MAVKPETIHDKKRIRGRPPKNTSPNDSGTGSITDMTSVSPHESTTSRANNNRKDADDTVTDSSAGRPTKKVKRDIQLKKDATGKEKVQERSQTVRRSAIDFDDDDDDDGMVTVQNTHHRSHNRTVEHNSSSNQGITDMKPTLKTTPSTSYRLPILFDDDDDD